MKQTLRSRKPSTSSKAIDILRRFSTRKRQRALIIILVFVVVVCYMINSQFGGETFSIESLGLKKYLTKESPYCRMAEPMSSTIVLKTNVTKQSTPPFKVIILTYNRAISLRRCLLSARNALYDRRRIDLDVWVDRSVAGLVDESVLSTLRAFTWPHGAKRVIVWDRHAGLLRQWIDTYKPQSDLERAVILEDDLELSPYYYRWLRGAIKAYDNRTDVFGYSLQRATLRAAPIKGRFTPIQIHKSEPVFFYFLVGSWGYSPHPVAWRRFRVWFHKMSCLAGFKPYVEGLLPTIWYKRQELKTRGATMWTMWHIRFADQFRMYTVYANLKDKTLCANWREKGLHYDGSLRGEAARIGHKDTEILRLYRDQNRTMMFKFPNDPRMVDWNGTYEKRSGRRTNK